MKVLTLGKFEVHNDLNVDSHDADVTILDDDYGGGAHVYTARGDLLVVGNGATFSTGEKGGYVVGRWWSKKYNKFRSKMVRVGKELEVLKNYKFYNGKFKDLDEDCCDDVFFGYDYNDKHCC
jgi:hypothetical protein